MSGSSKDLPEALFLSAAGDNRGVTPPALGSEGKSKAVERARSRSGSDHEVSNFPTKESSPLEKQATIGAISGKKRAFLETQRTVMQIDLLAKHPPWLDCGSRLGGKP